MGTPPSHHHRPQNIPSPVSSTGSSSSPFAFSCATVNSQTQEHIDACPHEMCYSTCFFSGSSVELNSNFFLCNSSKVDYQPSESSMALICSHISVLPLPPRTSRIARTFASYRPTPSHSFGIVAPFLLENYFRTHQLALTGLAHYTDVWHHIAGRLISPHRHTINPSHRTSHNRLPLLVVLYMLHHLAAIIAARSV